MPRCEDHSKGRHDRAYPFSVASSLDDHSALPRDGAPRDLLVAACGEPVELFPGDGVLIPVDRVQKGLDVDDQGRSCEAILPIGDSVEAVPGIWPTGSQEGMVLIAAKYEPVVIEAGETVAEVRRGRIAASECTRCHMWDSKFQDSCHFEDDSCSSCGTGILRPDSCSQCGSEEVRQVRLQGCEECIATDLNKEGAAREDEEVLPERVRYRRCEDFAGKRPTEKVGAWSLCRDDLLCGFVDWSQPDNVSDEREPGFLGVRCYREDVG